MVTILPQLTNKPRKGIQSPDIAKYQRAVKKLVEEIKVTTLE